MFPTWSTGCPVIAPAIPAISSNASVNSSTSSASKASLTPLAISARTSNIGISLIATPFLSVNASVAEYMSISPSITKEFNCPSVAAINWRSGSHSKPLAMYCMNIGMIKWYMAIRFPNCLVEIFPRLNCLKALNSPRNRANRAVINMVNVLPMGPERCNEDSLSMSTDCCVLFSAS